MKKISLSVLLVTLCSNFSSNIQAVDTENTAALIEALNNQDASAFFQPLRVSENSLQEEIQALLDRKINLDTYLSAKDEFTGETLYARPLDILLSLMIMEEDLPEIEFLLQNGANPNFIDPSERQSMLEMAQEFSNSEIIELLQKYGATE